jgi:hypothetical protein
MTLTDPEPPVLDDDPRSSTLDELRDIYRNDQPRKPLELGVPASRGRLVIRYGPPADRSQLSAVFRAVQSGEVLGDFADVDLIVDCCKDILRVTGPEPTDLEPLAGDGRPLRFDKNDPRLGQALGFDYVTAREAARKTFKDDEYPLSIAGHFQSLVAWLQFADDAALERVEGNSAGPSGA